MKELIKIVRYRIQSINPEYFQLSNIYRFKLDFPIGVSEYGIINDICVVTIMGTECILIMCSVVLSSEFDKKNLSESCFLRRRRLKGGAHG